MIKTCDVPTFILRWFYCVLMFLIYSYICLVLSFLMHFKMCFQGCQVRHMASPGWMWVMGKKLSKLPQPGLGRARWVLVTRVRLSSLLRKPCLQLWHSADSMHREHGLFICQNPLISSNLFNCLGFLVDIICVRDFIHTAMMYREHSRSW